MNDSDFKDQAKNSGRLIADPIAERFQLSIYQQESLAKGIELLILTLAGIKEDE